MPTTDQNADTAIVTGAGRGFGRATSVSRSGVGDVHAADVALEREVAATMEIQGDG